MSKLPNNKKIFTIKQASEALGVSTKTLRRWEDSGKLIPQRTAGGHRRYSRVKLSNFMTAQKQSKAAKKLQTPAVKVKTPPSPFQAYPEKDITTKVVNKSETPQVEKTKVQLPNIYTPLHINQKKVIKNFAKFSFAAVLVAMVVSSFAAFSKLGSNIANNSNFAEKVSLLSAFKNEPVEDEQGRVLADRDSLLATRFDVNVDANFAQNVAVSGTLNLIGNTITSSDDLLIQPTGGAVLIGDGIAANIDLEGNDLFVSGDIESTNIFATDGDFAGDIAIAGDTSTGSLTINADTFTDLTGTGLQVTDNVLETTLGDSITSAEITDGTITEADLSITNDASDNQILSYDEDTGTFTWVDDETGDTSLFTDGGTITYLSSETDDLALGGTTGAAPFFFDESAESLTIAGSITGGAIADGVASITSGAGTGFLSFAVDSLTLNGTVVASSGDLELNAGGGDLILTGFDCSANANGGTLTVDASGVVSCADDDGGGSASQWTDTGSILHPDESTIDEIAIGGTTEAGADIFLGVDGWTVFNEQGNDVDFRIESNTDANAFFVDGGNSRVGVGTNAPSALFSVGSSSEFQVNTSGQITAATNETINGIDISSGAISDVTTLTASSTITGGTLTDGTASITAGNGSGFLSFIVDSLTLNGTSLSSSGALSLTSSATGDVNITASDDLVLDDSQLTSAITLTDTATDFDSGDTGIVDAINTAYNAATGASGGTWTLSSGVLYPTTISNRVGVGTTTSGDVVSKLFVTGNSSLTGKAVAIFNQTESEDIVTASASGTTRLVLTNAGNLQVADITLGLNDSDATITTADTNESLTIDPNGTGSLTLGSADVEQLVIVTDDDSSNDVDITGSVTISNDLLISDALTVNGNVDFADSGSDTITIGDVNDTTSIVGSAWSVTTAGVATFTQANVDNLRLDGNTLSAQSGDLAFSAAGGQVEFVDTLVFNIGGINDVAYNAISDSGTANIAASDDDLYIEGVLEVDTEIEVDGTLDVDGAADFSAGVTNSAGELLVSGGNIQLNDSIALTLGTGDDLSLSFNGTASTINTTGGAFNITTTTSGDIDINSAGEIIFNDTRTGDIQLSAADTSFDSGDTGIVDAINTAYNAAVGSSPWTLDTNTIYPTSADDRVGIGTQTAASIISKLYVSGNSSLTGKSVSIFNQTEDEDIFTASASGATRLRLTNNGTLYIAGINTNSGNLEIDSAGGTTTVNDNFVIVGSTDARSTIANSTGNVVIADTVDLGSASTGINITTLGAISDSDGDVAINDNTNITGNLDVSGTLTSGTADAFQVSATGVITAATNETINGIDISSGAISDVTTLTASSTITGGTLTDGTASITSGAGTGFTSLVIDSLTIDGTSIASTAGFSLTTAASGDITLTASDDFILDDAQLSSAITLTDVDTGFDSGDTAIVDAINTAYSTALSSSPWTHADHYLYADDYWQDDLIIGGNATSSADIQLFANGAAVFNEQANDADFRVEGSGDANLFFADAGNNRIGIGDNTPAALFTVGNGDLFQINTAGIISTIDGVAHQIGDVSGDLALTSNSGTVSITNDLDVAGGDITSSATANLLNVTSTTINFGGAATSLNIADAAITGTIDIGGVTADGASTVNIATEGTTADAITIGNSNASTTLAITGGNDWSISTAGAASFTQVSIDSLTLDSTTLSSSSALSLTSAASGDINLTASDDIVFNDAQLSSAINLTATDTGFDSGDTAIVDAINTAYNAATGGGAGIWTLDTNTIYATSADDRLGLGTQTAASIISKLFVTSESNSNLTGKSLAIFDQNESQDILTASSSGTTVLTLNNTGDLVLNSTTANADQIVISPNTTGASTFAGTLTSSDLTADRTYTLPDETGTVCLSSGNCAGGAGGSKWTDSGTITYLTAYATDDVAIGDTGTSSEFYFDIQGADSGRLIMNPSSAGTKFDVNLETEWTSGTLFLADFASSTTQSSSDIVGINLDFNTNLTGAQDLDVTNFVGATPALTSSGATTTTYTGIDLSGGALDTADNGDATNVNWIGADITLPNIDTGNAADTTTAYGLRVTPGTVTNGLGTENEYGILVDAATADIAGGDASGDDLLLISTIDNTKGDIQFHSASYNINATGDLTIGGRITFENGEFIDNETDGSLDLNATTINLIGTSTVVSDQSTVALLNSTTTTVNAFGAATSLNFADSPITGTIDIGGVSADGANTINIATEATSADTLTVGNSNASTTIAITGGDDWSITTAGVGTFSQVNVDNLRLDGNTLSAQSGDINIDAAGDQVIFANLDTLNIGGVSGLAYNAISDAGTANIAASDNDLYIEGVLEVDTEVEVDGTLDVDGAADFSAGVTNSAGEFLFSAGNAQFNDSVVLTFGTGDDFSVQFNGTDSLLSTAGDFNFTATDDFIFDDAQLSSAITLTDTDASFSSGDTGIVDAINTAYNAAVGGGGGIWTLDTNTIYPATLGDRVGLGTETAADIISKLFVTSEVNSNLTGKSLAIFDQNEAQDILTASTSGTTRLVLENDGDLVLSSGDLYVGGNDIFDGGNNNVLSFDGSGNIDSLATIATTITQSGANQVTLTGNVDSQNGLDVTGASLTVGGSNATITTAGVITGTQLNIDNLRIDGNTLSAQTGNLILGSTTTDINSSTLDFSTQATDFELIDNTASALTISEGSNNYFAVDTTNTSENVSFGNATTNPTFDFLGSGAVTIASTLSVEGTSIGLNNDADVDSVIAQSAAAGQAGSDLYWGDDLLCDVSEANCGWTTAASSGPGGSDTQIQYNNGGSSFGGVSTFTYNDGTGALSITDDLDLTFAGTENLALTSDLAGTVDVINITTTPSATTGTTSGIYIDQADSANTNGLDTAILIDNSDTDLAIATGISFTSAGGGFTNFIDTPSSVFQVDGSGNVTLVDLTLTGGNITQDSADLTIATTTSGDLVLSSAGNQIEFANGDTFNVGGVTDLAYNAISDAGTANIAAGDNDLYIEDVLEVDGEIEVDGTLDVDGAADFSANLTNSAGELLVSGGNVQLNDSIVLTLGTGDDSSFQFNGTDTLLSTAGDYNFTAADDFIFDDAQLSSAITLTDTDTGFDSGDTGIVDAINTAYNAAVGSSPWTLSSNTIYPTTLGNRVGAGTTTAGDIISKLFVTSEVNSNLTGKSLAIFDQNEAEDILSASASGTTRFTVNNAGDILLGTAATNQTTIAQNGGAIFNEQGNDADFKIEGDTQDNLFFVDASTDQVGIGGDATPNALFSVGSTSQFQINTSGIIAAIDGIAHTIEDVSGDLSFNSNGGQINFADGDVFNIGGLTGVAYNAISDSGTANIAAGDDDLYVEDVLEVDGEIEVDGTLDVDGGANFAGGVDNSAGEFLFSAGNLQLNDSIALTLGTGDDLSISFDGTASTINTTGGAFNITTTTSGDIDINSAGEIIFNDTRTGDIQFSASDTSFDSGDTAVVDAINTAYNAATGGGSGLWTDGTTIIYPTSATKDLAIGGTSLAASIFSIDESAGDFFFGYDNSANPTLNFEATDGDAGEIGFNTNDSFFVSNANFGVGDTSPASLFTVGSGDLFQVNSSGQLTFTPATTGTFVDFALETEWTTGSLINADFGSSTTLTADVIGIDLNLNTNVTGVADGDVAGVRLQTPALTSSGLTTTNYYGVNIGGAGALDTTTDASATNVNWFGTFVQLPNIDTGNAADTTTAYGLFIEDSTFTDGLGTENIYAVFAEQGDIYLQEDGNGAAGGSGGDLILGAGGDLIFTFNGTDALITTAGDFNVTATDDFVFDDAQLLSAVTLTDVDTALPNSNTGIIDAINDAYNAAVGGGGGIWTLSSNTIYPTTLGNRIGAGTTTAGDIISKLFVTSEVNSNLTGKSLLILDQNESEDIFTASASGTTRITLNNAGDLLFGTAAINNTTISQNGGAIFNEQGNDTDFRIEGDTDANLFFVDASTDRIGIGDSTPSSLFTVGSGDLFQIDSTGSIVNIDGVAHSIADTTGSLDINSNGGLVLTANGAGSDITLTSPDDFVVSIADNGTNSFDLQEGSNNYINIATSNGSENISFGNATTNPSFSFLGSGAATITGSADGTDALILTAGDILVTDGDIDISAGDFNVTLDDGNTAAINGDGSPTADVLSLSSGTSATDGVDNLQLTFGVSAASGNVIDITPSYADATAGATSETYNIIDIDAFTATQNATGDTGLVRALNIGNLTQTETAGTITANALNIGTGWDAILDYNGTTVIDGTGQLVSTQLTGTLFSTDTDTASANTIVQGDTLTINGDSAGIDVTHSGDTITVAFDGTEVANETWGAGSGFTWTFDAGATDPTIVFGSDDVAVNASVFSLDSGYLELQNAERIENSINDLIGFLGVGGADNTDFYINLDGTRPVLSSIADTSVGIDDDLVFVGAQTLSTSAGDLTIDPNGGQVTFADGDTFNIGAVTGLAYNAISDAGTANIAATDNDLYIEGVLEVDTEIEVDGTLDVDGAADFSAGLTNSAGELLVSGGNVQLEDGILLTFGTGDDISISHSGTAGTISNATGDLVIDNTGATNSLALRLGTDTSATNFQVRNNSDTSLFEVDGSGVATLAGSAGSNVFNITAGDAVLSDGSISITDADNAASLSVTNNTATTIGAGVTTAGVIDFSSTSLTTGNLLNLETTTSLTSGRVLNASSTSTALTTGSLGYFDWSPGSATTATGDLFYINMGTNGSTTGSLFNVADTGSSLFKIGENTITNALPTEFTAAGDVSIAYDIQFTNQTAATVKSDGPLSIESGETFESQNLTLTTYNSGDIVLDPASGAALVQGAFAVDSQTTFTDQDATPSVSDSSHYITANTVATVITDFDDGHNGQIIFVEINDANTDFDCTASGLNCGSGDMDIVAAGDLTSWIYDGTDWNLINWMDDSQDYGVAGSDVAEFFPASETLIAGEVVAIDATNPVTVKKASEENSSKTIGIVATDPGLILGEETENSFPIALAGRVPVKIDPTSEAIQPGDLVGASTQSGFGKKVNGGYIVGRALEAWTPGTSQESVTVFVNPIQVSENFADNSQVITDLESRIANLEYEFGINPQATESATTSFTDLNLDTLSVSGDTVLGDTVVTGTLDVGTLQFNPIENSIDAVGILKIQSLALDNIEFMGGLITMDTEGNIQAVEITAEKYNVAGASAGTETLPAGDTQIFVESTAVTADSLIFVNPKSAIFYPLSVTQKVDGQGFWVEIYDSEATSTEFDWWIVDKTN